MKEYKDNKFHAGDKVRVTKVSNNTIEDMNNLLSWNEDYLNQVGIIVKTTLTQGIYQYSIDFFEPIDEEVAWFSEKQLEMINKNPNYN